MTTSHTPGPWHCGGTAGQIVYAPDGYAVCSAMTYHGHRSGDKESRANARLIAAAPDMLAALQYVLDADNRGDLSDMQPVRDAIAKATGGTDR